MKEFSFSLYPTVRSKQGEVVTLPWSDWTEFFTIHEERPEKDGPCVLLGHAAGPHTAANVKAVHALALDIETASDQEIAALDRRLSGLAHVCYTTHRHGEPGMAKSRLRYVVPLAEPLAPAEFAIARQRFDAWTFELCDDKARDLARLHYLPSTFNKALARARANQGDFLVVAELPVPETAQANPATPGDAADAEELRRFLDFSLARQSSNPKVKTAARAVLDGKPFAPPGERHDVARDLTLALAFRRGVPFARSVLEDVFAPSVKLMTDMDKEAPGFDDLWRCYEGGLEIARKKGHKWAEGASEAMTPEELATLAEKLGASSMDDAWVVQRGTVYYVANPKLGCYSPPFTRDDVRPVMAKLLKNTPVRLVEFTKTGVRRRTAAEIVEDHGRVVSKVIVSMSAQKSHINETQDAIVEACCPLRSDLAPRYDEAFDKFLDVFAGDQAEKLRDWLACVPDCGKLLCVLYLSGSPGTGKTSIAHGVAKLWNDGPPTGIVRFLSEFNADLCDCPLVLGDEHIPVTWKGGSVTKAIRNEMSVLQRTLSRKYQPGSALVGAIRMVLCANDEFLLRSTEVMGPDDLTAVSQRFLYIRANDAAKEFVEKTPSAVKEQWVQRTIAEHTLWLAANREVKRGKRFWVEGDVSQMHRLLLAGSEMNAMVCQWLCYYLTNPEPVDNDLDCRGLVRVFPGRFMVNDKAVIVGWKHYFGEHARVEPTVAKVGAALRAVSHRERERYQFEGYRIRYRVIDLDTLFAWSDSSGIGSKEQMEVTLKLREPPDIEMTEHRESIGASQHRTKKQEPLRRKPGREPGEDDGNLGY